MVRNWPFLILTNSLGITFDASDAGSDETTCVSATSNFNESVVIVVDDVALYPKKKTDKEYKMEAR